MEFKLSERLESLKESQSHLAPIDEINYEMGERLKDLIKYGFNTGQEYGYFLGYLDAYIDFAGPDSADAAVREAFGDSITKIVDNWRKTNAWLFK